MRRREAPERVGATQLINSNLTVLFQQAGCSFEPGAAGRSSLGCAPPRQHAVDLFAGHDRGRPRARRRAPRTRRSESPRDARAPRPPGRLPPRPAAWLPPIARPARCTSSHACVAIWGGRSGGQPGYSWRMRSATRATNSASSSARRSASRSRRLARASASFRHSASAPEAPLPRRGVPVARSACARGSISAPPPKAWSTCGRDESSAASPGGRNAR